MSSGPGGATVLPLRFQIGARTLAAIPRRLVRVALSLEDVLAGRVPTLPALARGMDGILVTSLRTEQVDTVAMSGWLAHVRQRYNRYHVDLSIGVAAWEATLSSTTRAGLKRKAKKLADATILRYATPAEIAAFHPLARQVSGLTYQEKLLDAGLPESPDDLLRLAGADRVRAWLLFVADRPVAYLCCTAEGDTLRYDHVGHDPAESARSPGAVLQAAALRDLLDERRFCFFDFTEGEGQHKRSLATGETACVDLLLLRPTLANRAALAALATFDRAITSAKRMATHPTLGRLAVKVRR